MKLRRLSLLILMMLAISFPAAADQYRLTIVASCEDFNHVGKDWYFQYFLNDQSFEYSLPDGSRTIESPCRTLVEVEDGAEIRTIITEQDRRPDVGERKDVLKLEYNEEYGCYTFEQMIDVSESSGKYAHSTCRWTITWLFDKMN